MKKIYVKFYLSNGKTREYNRDHITNKLWNLVSLKPFTKAYVKVSYGMKLDNYGKKVMFSNEGYYTDKEQLKAVIKDFWNEE